MCSVSAGFGKRQTRQRHGGRVCPGAGLHAPGVPIQRLLCVVQQALSMVQLVIEGAAPAGAWRASNETTAGKRRRAERKCFVTGGDRCCVLPRGRTRELALIVALPDSRCREIARKMGAAIRVVRAMGAAIPHRAAALYSRPPLTAWLRVWGVAAWPDLRRRHIQRFGNDRFQCRPPAFQCLTGRRWMIAVRDGQAGQSFAALFQCSEYISGMPVRTSVRMCTLDLVHCPPLIPFREPPSKRLLSS